MKQIIFIILITLFNFKLSFADNSFPVGYKGVYLNITYKELEYKSDNEEIEIDIEGDEIFSKTYITLNPDNTVKNIKLTTLFEDLKEGYTCRDYLLSFDEKILNKYGNIIKKQSSNFIDNDKFKIYYSDNILISLDCLYDRFNVNFKSDKILKIQKFKSLEDEI